MTEQYVEELIRKYSDGSASDEEIKKLIRWYHSLPDDGVAWPSADSAEKQNVHSRMLDRLRSETSKPIRSIIFSWSKIAAILALFLAAATIMIYFLKPFSKSYITVTNPSGKVQLVQLPDNSNVWLNASSTLRYVKRFKETRELELQGEAYFEVTHDAKHPFSVNAGGIKTTVLGTTFNIKAYGSLNKTSVSVINGKVSVTDNSKELAVLTPSMQLQFNRQNQTSETFAIDTNSVVAWKKGRLQFQGETFKDIANTIEAWYGIKIIFARPGMLSCRYYMSFDNTTSLDKLMSTMAQVTEMEYVFDKSRFTVTISGKECK